MSNRVEYSQRYANIIAVVPHLRGQDLKNSDIDNLNDRIGAAKRITSVSPNILNADQTRDDGVAKKMMYFRLQTRYM